MIACGTKGVLEFVACFPKTSVCANSDGLMLIVLRVKRPQITPPYPSSSRLDLKVIRQRGILSL